MSKELMAMSGIKKGLKMFGNSLVKQSPIILTIAAVGGVATTVFLAVRGTLAAEEVIEAKKEERGIPANEKLPLEDVIASCWRCYIPTAISTTLTIGAIVASSAINEKRKAALASLYALSESALKEYQDKTEEVAGKTTAQKIKDEVNADKVKDDITPPWFTEEDLPAGKCLVKDIMSGTIFCSSVDEIRRAAIDLNEGIMSGDMCASLNDFYELLNIDWNGAPPDFASDCGWKIGHLCVPYFTSALMSDGRPIVVLEWSSNGRPEYDYRDI